MLRCSACPPLSRLSPLPFLFAAACGGGTPGSPVAPPAPPWPQLTAAALQPGQQAQLAAADAARSTLAQRLLAELTGAIAAHGTRAAISVCKVRAPELATEVGSEHKLRLGRTSHRLRSGDNRPPAWARDHLETTADGPQLFAGPGGELGVLQPIVLMEMCVQCHGRTEQLAPGVAAALQTLYPEDRATGFAPGQRRGWFWIEVPKAP